LVAKQKCVKDILCELGNAKEYYFTMSLFEDNKQTNRTLDKNIITNALVFYGIELKENLKELGYEEVNDV